MESLEARGVRKAFPFWRTEERDIFLAVGALGWWERRLKLEEEREEEKEGDMSAEYPNVAAPDIAGSRSEISGIVDFLRRRMKMVEGPSCPYMPEQCSP